MMLFQAASNLIGDYFDYKHKIDLPDSLNGVRHISSGKFSPKMVLCYGFVLLFFAMVLGLIILINSNFSYIWIGILGALMVCFYPFLKYNALGDVDVLLGYAIMPSIGMSYVMSGRLFLDIIWLSLSFGLLTVAILHANNTRDIKNDTRAKITTFAILIGEKTAKKIYYIELIIPYILIIIYIIFDFPIYIIITLCTIPMAISNIKLMHKLHNDETIIADLDKRTASLQLTFGLLLSLSLILAAIL